VSVGPVVAGVYMQTHQESIFGISASFPSAEAYNFVFLTASVASLSFVVLAIILKRKKNPSSMADPIFNQ
jgi:hypothetical protein